MERLQVECARAPTLPETGYRGLLSDVHVHVPPNVDHVEWAIALLQEMNEHGIGRVVVQPIHAPDGDGTWLRVVDDAMGAISEACPRIISLVYGFDPSDPEAWRYVEQQLDTGRFGGVGELALSVQTRGFRVDPTNPTMRWIYERLNATGGVLHLQTDLTTPGMRHIIEMYPDMNFLWFGGCSSAGAWAELDNLYCDVVPGPTAVNPDRLLFGSDAGPAAYWEGPPFLPYDGVGTAAAYVRELLATWPKADADKIASGNLDRIFPTR